MNRRTFTKLEDWRDSRAGLLLFYGYLIAVMIVGCLALVAYHRGAQADVKLRHEIALGQERGARSCQAIKGAVALWTQELRAARLLEKDTTLPASIRAANAIRARALEATVEFAQHTPSCGDGS